MRRALAITVVLPTREPPHLVETSIGRVIMAILAMNMTKLGTIMVLDVITVPHILAMNMTRFLAIIEMIAQVLKR
jgi:hypothetical protein